MLKGILALVEILPKVFSYIDLLIGAINRRQDAKRRNKVNERDIDRNSLTRELETETDEKKRRALLRRLNRHG